MLFGGAYRFVVDCSAETPEGISLSEFARGQHVRDTLDSLDIDEWSRVFVVESARRDRRVEDNRRQPHWLMDDLKARRIEDREA